mgnify:CR=1 FL=1
MPMRIGSFIFVAALAGLGSWSASVVPAAGAVDFARDGFDAAVRMGEAVAYASAGTVEFVVDARTQELCDLLAIPQLAVESTRAQEIAKATNALEAETAELRSVEARVESGGAFNIRNVVPGDYLIHARAAEEGDPPRMISIREDSDLRTTVTREAEKAKQSVTLKACERLENYEFAYPPTTKP